MHIITIEKGAAGKFNVLLKQELDYGQSKIRNGLYRALSPSA